MLDPSDTIVAIASHLGPASRGIIRLSGPEALAIALDGFEGDGPMPIPARPMAYSGRLVVSGLASPLPATLALWPGPRSYTGQPVAEIQTIGSPPLLRHLVTRYLSLGARAAEPGEFTLRAFLAGRIDLAQSEAVLAVIEARTPVQLDSALRSLAGGLAAPVRDLRDRLLDQLVDLEANLDFVEESDVAPVARTALVENLALALQQLDELPARFRSRDRSDCRPRVVLAGQPNAGKSRLFNALLGNDHAIVSEVRGTTRDDLVATCHCDGLLVDLVDTAGEELSATPIEASAQARRAEQVEAADLVLLCVPAMDDAGPSGAPTTNVRATLFVATKVDLLPSPTPSESLPTSATTGQGLDELRRAIASELRARLAEFDGPHALGSRFREGLARAAEAVHSALDVASTPGGEELIAAELHRAIDDLGALVGEVVTEDILDRIFRRFCVGK